jgi:indole-3-glycerol phosphate synthase
MDATFEPAVVQTGTILDKIVAHKHREVEVSRSAHPLDEILALAAQAPTPRAFAKEISAPGVSLIAEVKRASPSKGPLRTDINPGHLARAYVDGSAVAISVLTDIRFFGGTLQDLEDVHRVVPVPVLCKDFVVDPYQVYEARASGADAVLLIMAILTDATYTQLLALIQSLGMVALVEVHDRVELDRALTANPPIVGINNRDLHTFQINLETTCALRPLVPASTLVVAESGIQSPADVARLADAGVDAVLVGTALVMSADPGALARQLVEAGAPPDPRKAQKGRGQ